MENKKVRKHSLCEKNAVIAMILTVPLGLLTQLSGQPQGVVSWGFWVVLYAWVPFVCYRVFDDVSPEAP